MSDHKKVTELKRRLEREPVPLPPAALLERLKKDIPDPITLQRERGSTPSTLWGVWQIAASVLVVITGAFAALWMGNEVAKERAVPTAALEQKTPSDEASRGAFSDRVQPPASPAPAEATMAEGGTDSFGFDKNVADAVKPSVSAAPVAEAGLESEAVFAPEPESKDDLAATGEARAKAAPPIVADADLARERKAGAEEDAAAAPAKLAARDEKRKDQARAVPAAAPPIVTEMMTQSNSVGGARQTALLDDLRRTLDSGSMPDPGTVRTDDVIRSLSTVSTERVLPDTESSQSPFAGTNTMYILVRRGGVGTELDQRSVSRYRVAGSDSWSTSGAASPARPQQVPVLIESSISSPPAGSASSELRKNEAGKEQAAPTVQPSRWAETSRSFRTTVLAARLADGLRGRLTRDQVVELQRIVRQESGKAPDDANLIRLRDLTDALERVVRGR